MLYLTLGAAIVIFQGRLIYQPSEERGSAADSGLPPGFEIMSATGDGLTLRHYYIPSGDPEAPLIVVLHGSGGSAADRWDKFSPLVAEGLSLVLAEYRGYGGNPGEPSEEGLLEDARALLRHLEEVFSIPSSRIVLYGESLGAAVAVALAREHAVRGLVLEAAFTSFTDLAITRFPLYPVDWLFRERFEVLEPLSALETPLLLLHGEEDDVVPVSHGKRLLEAAKEPKRGVFITGAGHEHLPDYGIMPIVADYAEKLLPPVRRVTP